MIEIYSNNDNGSFYEQDDYIVFNKQTVRNSRNRDITPTDNVVINMSGYYEVNVTCTLASATSAGNVGVILNVNGEDRKNTNNKGYSDGSNKLVTISFSTIEKVKAGCMVCDMSKTVRVKVTGNNAYVYNANMTIKRV